MITVADEDVIAATGRAEHANLVFNGKDDSRVSGTALEVILRPSDRISKRSAPATGAASTNRTVARSPSR